jgi:ankyrin repeat protein
MAGILTLNSVEEAVLAGDVKTVQAGLTQRGKAALSTNGVMNTWFWVACECGHIAIAQLLLSLDKERAIDVHEEDEWGFRWACLYGHTKVATLLLLSPSLVGERMVNVHAAHESAFLSACSKRYTELVRLLLGLGGDRAIDVRVRKQHALRWACYYDYMNVAVLLLSYRSSEGMPAAETVRQGGEWGCIASGRWHALAERPMWLAAVRRSGAMAARAIRRGCGRRGVGPKGLQSL